MECVQRREAELVLQKCGHTVPSLPNTQIFAALMAEFARLGAEETHRAVVAVLKRTRCSAELSCTLGSVPASLAAAILGIRLRQCERARLAQAMDVELATTEEWARE